MKLDASGVAPEKSTATATTAAVTTTTTAAAAAAAACPLRITTHCDELLLSDTSSLLSSPLSRSPSPPSSAKKTFHSYPSPPPSQEDSGGPPSPENDNSGPDDAATRPAKRRRVSSTRSSLPRDTKRLNLEELSHSVEQREQLDRLIKGLKNKRKIVVIAGAGISVSAGVPDFRSSTGLFKSLRAEHKLKSSGKHLFDASVYRDASSTSSFHTMVRSLSELVTSARPTPFHHLLARLASEGRLLRLYTQNVDGIDTSMEPLATQVPLPRKAPWPKTIQVHGGLDHMTCTKCHALSSFRSELFQGPVPPECTTCLQMDQVRTEVAGKRSHGVGKLRPRMVLYNEHNPDDEAIGAVTRADMRTRPDAVIVVGTSLKIPGVKRIVKEMCSIVRDRRDGLTVWINNDPEPSGKDFENSWDLIVKGSCDAVAGYAGLRQWDDDSPADEVQEVTDQELQDFRERGQASVVVMTPSRPIKYSKNRDVDDSSLLTPPPYSPKVLPEDDISPGTGEFTFRLHVRPSSSPPSQAHHGSFGTIETRPSAPMAPKERKKPGPKSKPKPTSAAEALKGAQTATKRTLSGASKTKPQQPKQPKQPKQTKAKASAAGAGGAKISSVFKASKSTAAARPEKSLVVKAGNNSGSDSDSTISNLKIKLPKPIQAPAQLPPLVVKKDAQDDESVIVVTPKKPIKTMTGKMSPVRFPNLQKA